MFIRETTAIAGPGEMVVHLNHSRMPRLRVHRMVYRNDRRWLRAGGFLKAFVDHGSWKLNSVQIDDPTVNDQSNLSPRSAG